MTTLFEQRIMEIQSQMAILASRIGDIENINSAQSSEIVRIRAAATEDHRAIIEIESRLASLVAEVTMLESRN